MSKTVRYVAAGVLACAATLAPQPAAAQPDITRGRALYELRCLGCHAESVHARAKRVAKDFDEVRAWVARWNTSLSLYWEAKEVDDVALYLNHAYYQYPCPPTTCKVVSLR
jgi:hypothetical protein